MSSCVRPRRKQNGTKRLADNRRSAAVPATRPLARARPQVSPLPQLRCPSQSASIGSAVLEEHLDYFTKIAVQLIEGLTLRMRAGEARHEAHIQARLGTALNHGCVVLHNLHPDNSGLPSAIGQWSLVTLGLSDENSPSYFCNGDPQASPLLNELLAYKVILASGIRRGPRARRHNRIIGRA